MKLFDTDWYDLDSQSHWKLYNTGKAQWVVPSCKILTFITFMVSSNIATIKFLTHWLAGTILIIILSPPPFFFFLPPPPPLSRAGPEMHCVPPAKRKKVYLTNPRILKKKIVTQSKHKSSVNYLCSQSFFFGKFLFIWKSKNKKSPINSLILHRFSCSCKTNTIKPNQNFTCYSMSIKYFSVKGFLTALWSKVWCCCTRTILTILIYLQGHPWGAY